MSRNKNFIEGGSYVGMANCFLCNKPKHLLLDRRLKNSLPQNAVYDKEPCEDCLKWMEKGVIFIGVDEEKTTDAQNPYRSGEWFVLKDDAVKRMPFNDEMREQVLKERVCFISSEVILKLGLKEHIEKAKKEEAKK